MVVYVFTARRARITSAVRLPSCLSYYSRCATHNQSGRRVASNQLRSSWYTAQTIVLRLPGEYFQPAQTEPRPPLQPRYEWPLLVVERREKTALFKIRRDLSITAWISIDRLFIARENSALTYRHTYTHQSNPTTTSNRISHRSFCCYMFVTGCRTCPVHAANSRARLYIATGRARARFFAWLDVTSSSCIGFSFAFLSTNPFELSPDRLCATFVNQLFTHTWRSAFLICCSYTHCNIANVLSKFVVCLI